MKKGFMKIAVILIILVEIVGGFSDSIYAADSISQGKKMIYAGQSHSLALKKDGTVWAWGSNEYGQLGDGTTKNKLTPVKVKGLTSIVAVSGGSDYSLAVKKDGTVWAWGLNEYGQLGDGTTKNKITPVKVKGLTGVKEVSGGSRHSLAVKQDGTVWAWGDNGSGQLGDGTTKNKSIPVLVQGLADIVAVSGGANHSLAVKQDGTVWAWGDNWFGQLGVESGPKSIDKYKTKPIQVQTLTDIVEVSGGADYSLALRQDGKVWAWGRNGHGQLGNGKTAPIANQIIPIQPEGLTDVLEVAGTLGGFKQIALKEDGTVWTWGKDISKLGNITSAKLAWAKIFPVQMQGLTDIESVSGGIEHSLALKQDGTVWAWGKNELGQLGDGTTKDKSTPVQVKGFKWRN